MPRALILYSSRSEDQSFASTIATQLGLQWIHTPDLDDTIQAIQSHEIGAVIVDASYDEKFFHFEKAITEKIGLFSDKLNTNLFHYLATEDIDSLNHLTQSPIMGSFILRKFKTFEEAQKAGLRYSLVIRASQEERAFGLRTFFGKQAQIQTVKLKSASQKQQICESIRSYLLKAKYPSRMANSITNAVDELVMNAIFTAPVNELGQKLFDKTPRDADLSLDEKHQVEVTVAFDGSQVAISATDRFGSIDKEKIVYHLSTIYRDENYRVTHSTTSAGIGLATTYRGGGSVLIICEKNTKTEVAIVFERFDNYRAFRDQFRYIAIQYYL